MQKQSARSGFLFSFFILKWGRFGGGLLSFRGAYGRLRGITHDKNALVSENKKHLETIRFQGVDFVAGAEGVEPSTNGFGDRYSTN